MFFGRQDVFRFVRETLVGRYRDNGIVLFNLCQYRKISFFDRDASAALIIEPMEEHYQYSNSRFVAAISKSRIPCSVKRPARLRNRGYNPAFLPITGIAVTSTRPARWSAFWRPLMGISTTPNWCATGCSPAGPANAVTRWRSPTPRKRLPSLVAQLAGRYRNW